MLSLLSGSRLWNHTKITGLIDRVTARVQNAVRRRVAARLPSMNVHEARGYIRARAAAVIRREMQIIVAEDRQLTTRELEQITAGVRRRIVRRLLLENLRRIEPAHKGFRRAA